MVTSVKSFVSAPKVALIVFRAADARKASAGQRHAHALQLAGSATLTFVTTAYQAFQPMETGVRRGGVEGQMAPISLNAART
mmetsp:Transcript_3446/g.21615  ORF Transcript_3446/g.21615 Transcript_3446/m.21615 type:complete len:82 (-) Transcript_3446:1881-2126(-)